jgi:hypothetical protein
MFPCLIGEESGDVGTHYRTLAGENWLVGGKIGKARLSGAFAPSAPAFEGETSRRQNGHVGCHSTRTLSERIPMIRISFETRTDSEDPVAPNAWRREAAARLREIAKRIATGEAMPLILLGSDGNSFGKAREISYRPEPAQSAAKPPHSS